jgi:hypothetical protein
MPPDEFAGGDIPVASTPAEPDRRKRLRLLVARLPVDPDLAPAVTPPLRHGPTPLSSPWAASPARALVMPLRSRGRTTPVRGHGPRS